MVGVVGEGEVVDGAAVVGATVDVDDSEGSVVGEVVGVVVLDPFPGSGSEVDGPGPAVDDEVDGAGAMVARAVVVVLLSVVVTFGAVVLVTTSESSASSVTTLPVWPA